MKSRQNIKCCLKAVVLNHGVATHKCVAIFFGCVAT